MSEITLVRNHGIQVTEAEQQAARKVLFGHIDGLGEKGKKQWRRLINRLFKLEPGEMMDIKTHQERLGWYHRKHMAMEQALYESQERFENFEAMRTWLKVGAGFVDWFPGAKGGVIPVPKSISFASLEQAEMEQVHSDMVQFLRTAHAQKTLWNHLDEAARSEMMEVILGSFGE